jgi:nicotinamide mononucleotide adenylyltransferase
MEISSNKPKFDKRIFWDVDFEKLNYETKASFIIERVFDRGDVEDIRQCRRFYGDEKIKVVLLNTKFLSLGRIHLASAVIDEPLNAFRCYRLRQLNPELFPY